LVDNYIRKTGMNVPEETFSDQGVTEPEEVLHPILEIDLKAAGISSIIWGDRRSQRLWLGETADFR
jgi:putative flavoprotein involved in K+ transport